MSTIIVFFFKQKTAYEMRISDWSSDVCSSDLPRYAQIGVRAHEIGFICQHRKARCAACLIGAGVGGRIEIDANQPLGRASFLNLCDEAIAIFGMCTVKRRLEAAHR